MVCGIIYKKVKGQNSSQCVNVHMCVELHPQLRDDLCTSHLHAGEVEHTHIVFLNQILLFLIS